MTNRDVIDGYFSAMRRGATAEEQLLSLFADDAVYSEPFIDERPAQGIAEIRERFRRGWEQPLPDLELDVLSLEVDGSVGRSTWECRSPGLPGPVRGEDRYEIEDGKITRLEVRITDGV
jgi:hypothetical protein